MNDKNIGLRVAGAVFALVAAIHLLRLVVGFHVAVGRFPIPLWVNGVGLVVAGGLAAWMFRLGRK